MKQTITIDFDDYITLLVILELYIRTTRRAFLAMHHVKYCIPADDLPEVVTAIDEIRFTAELLNVKGVA